MSTVRNYLGFTINAVLHPAFNRKLCYKLSSIVTFTLIHNFLSKASNLPRLLDTASKFAWFSVSGLKDEKLIKKANIHENWNMQTLFYDLVNISAKFRQNCSLQFWAIPFQIWCIFETVLRCRALKAEGVQLYHMWPEGIDRPVFNSSL